MCKGSYPIQLKMARPDKKDAESFTTCFIHNLNENVNPQKASI